MYLRFRPVSFYDSRRRLEGNFGSVIYLTQMSQYDVLESGMHHLMKQP